MLAGLIFSESSAIGSEKANRFTYLDETDPFYPNVGFARLETPQWVGEPGVNSVIILGVDGVNNPEEFRARYELLLSRLKRMEGHSPVSVMCGSIDPTQPLWQALLKDGVSLECNTSADGSPILDHSDFQRAADLYDGGVDLVNRIPGNEAMAFRARGCDEMNNASPRFFDELFCGTNSRGQFLTIDSSVANIFSRSNRPTKDLAAAAGSRGQSLTFAPGDVSQTIENYPFPYVIDRLCWEFPAAAGNWKVDHLPGASNDSIITLWHAGLDAAVLKRGVFTLVVPLRGTNDELLADLAVYAASKYGAKTKFLNFREAGKRLNRNLLLGNPLRDGNGEDNGVRLMDLNNDGYMDVLIANAKTRTTRIWQPQEGKWLETGFPTDLVTMNDRGKKQEAGVRFGVVTADGLPIMLVRNERISGAWRFDGRQWLEEPDLLQGLELNGHPIFTSKDGRDCGVRLRDIDNDGVCELIVGNESQNAVFAWSTEEKRWERRPFSLPPGTGIVDAQGRDNGLRFVDVNGDGLTDVLFSNAKQYSLHLFVAKPMLGFAMGWSREVMAGEREGRVDEVPMIVRTDPHRDNGVWFRQGSMWVQNEDTGALPNHTGVRTFRELMAGGPSRAKSPLESRAAMHPRPGFKVELVASEPLTKSPIAFDWGADGKFWVVEMGDYPMGLDGKGKPGGVIRFLEDSKGSGHYDKSTVFLDGLPFPTGIIPWRRGVIVCDPPEIFYAEDTNGDGRADTHVTLFTGFGEGNQQHRANGFDYGLDNWIYGANGDSGGTIVSLKTGKTVDISGRDFRFRPDDGAFETQAGQAQYGRHRDDWGNWFGIENTSPGWHYYPPENYLSRNPFLPVPATRVVMARYEDSTRVYATSRETQRFNDPESGASHLTSANSVMPYRDTLFGPEFEGSYFISEPVHNLIHREVMEHDGVTFTSHRAADEQTNEFLSSGDTWFRPTMTKTGPDGALYVADMYRLVIEHPEWIPLDSQKSLDLRAGENMGRIYRIYPSGATLRKIPRLDDLDARGLVTAMDSPNGWQRDTAQRLLVERGDPTAVGPLEKLVARSREAKTRLQALGTLDGLSALKQSVLMGALTDGEPVIRETALRLGEKLFDKSPSLLGAAAALTNDADLRVRCQLAFSLGESHDLKAGRILAELAMRSPNDPELEMAVLSSSMTHIDEMLATVLEEGNFAQKKLLRRLVGQAVAMDDERALIQCLGVITRSGGGRDSRQFEVLAGWLEALHRRSQTLAAFEAKHPELSDLAPRLTGVFQEARECAADPAAEESDRLAAIVLLGGAVPGNSADQDELGRLLSAQNSPAIQGAALEALGAFSDDRTADILIATWNGSLPSMREKIIELLSSHRPWMGNFLAAIEGGKISPDAVGVAERQRLLGDSQASVRERAAKSFRVAVSDRHDLIERYEQVKGLHGDPARGIGYFRQNCTPCHRLQNEGNEVGPNLGSVSFKSADYLMTAILDPNLSVEPRYISYVAVTKGGEEYTGILSAETANGITMRLPGGADTLILRSELKELRSTRRSLMPDGFENVLDPQALADLIAFVRSSALPKALPGNMPRVVDPGSDGSLTLTAAKGKVFGDTLVFEERNQNLGYWNSDNDRVVWSVNARVGGTYDVWFEWALEEEHAGNVFEFEAGDSVLTGEVSATGSWDDFRRKNLGTIELQAGVQSIELRGRAPLKGTLFDLRGVRLVPVGGGR